MLEKVDDEVEVLGQTPLHPRKRLERILKNEKK